VIRDRGVDVDRVDIGIFEEFVVVGVAPWNAKSVLNGLQFLGIALADGEEMGVGVGLVDRNKFRTEAETDDGDIYFFAHEDWEKDGIISGFG